MATVLGLTFPPRPPKSTKNTQVLVLDKGALVEYDTPLALLQRAGSRLRAMAERTGDLGGLITIAQEAAAGRKKGPGAAVQ